MPAKWKEIARLRFKGARFNDRALDAAALGEVQRYLRLVEETAKALWRADHQERERLPAGFEEQNRPCLRQVTRGSAVAVIEARVEDNRQTEFLDRGAERLVTAADFTHSVYAALAKDRPLPERLPKELVSDYADLGKTLVGDEAMELKAAGRKSFVCYRPDYRERWQTFAPQPHEAGLEQTGEIVEADVRQGRFQIWTEGKTPLPALFKPEQEAFVTSALHDHRSLRVRVAGRAEFSADGKPLRFLEVTALAVVPAEALLFNLNAPPVEEEIGAIWDDVPASEWEKLPADLTDHLDHYLYGTPKR